MGISDKKYALYYNVPFMDVGGLMNSEMRLEAVSDDLDELREIARNRRTKWAWTIYSQHPEAWIESGDSE